MSDFSQLSTSDMLQLIARHSTSDVFGVATELLSRNKPAMIPQLIGLMSSTNDAIVRNELALALSETSDPSVFAKLVELIKDEKTRSARGTLLYAIGNYDCTSILPLLIDAVITGNFEASRQSLSLISGIENLVDEQVLVDGIKKVDAALASASDERRPLLAELLSILQENQN